MAVEAQGTALVGRRQKPAWMRLKLPALSCNGAGKLWAAGRRKAAGLSGRRLDARKTLENSDGQAGEGEGRGDGVGNVIRVLALREMRRKLDPRRELAG
jgi:hypothetical protein